VYLTTSKQQDVLCVPVRACVRVYARLVGWCVCHGANKGAHIAAADVGRCGITV
jgi:hypothetical protein